MSTGRELHMKFFSLYARSRVASQLGADMLPLARRHALEALELMALLDRPGPEEELMGMELLDIVKSIK